MEGNYTNTYETFMQDGRRLLQLKALATNEAFWQQNQLRLSFPNANFRPNNKNNKNAAKKLSSNICSCHFLKLNAFMQANQKEMIDFLTKQKVLDLGAKKR